MARLSGHQAYVEALPVPRLAPMPAVVSFWVIVQVPGAVATLVLAVVRFHVHLHVSVLIVPAAVMVALTAAALGSALSMSLAPTVTQPLTQLLSFGLLLFSPVNFPLGRLPLALQDVHRGLPVLYMADIVRGTLTGRYDSRPALAFAVVGAWCAAALLISARAAARRG